MFKKIPWTRLAPGVMGEPLPGRASYVVVGLKALTELDRGPDEESRSLPDEGRRPRKWQTSCTGGAPTTSCRSHPELWGRTAVRPHRWRTLRIWPGKYPVRPR